MPSLWSFIAKPGNREVLSWLGGGIVTVAIGAWAVVTYVWTPSDPAKSLCAQQGVAIAGNVSGSTLSNSVSSSSSSGPCAETKKAP